jgi:hypothetical protein
VCQNKILQNVQNHFRLAMSEPPCPFLARMPHLIHLAQAHDPEIPSFSSPMSLVKAQLYTAMIKQPARSMGRLSLSVLESLVALAMEDIALAGHPGNTWDSLDTGMAAMQCLPSGSKYLALDYLARTRASVRNRKHNIDNRLEAGTEGKLNFLNRLDQMEQALSVLRSHLLTYLLWTSGPFSPSRESKGAELNNNAGRKTNVKPGILRDISVDSSSESNEAIEDATARANEAVHRGAGGGEEDSAQPVRTADKSKAIAPSLPRLFKESSDDEESSDDDK